MIGVVKLVVSLISERPKITSLFVVLASLCVPLASVLKPALRTSYFWTVT